MRLEDVAFLAGDAGPEARAAARALRDKPLHQRHRALTRAYDSDRARVLLEQDDLERRAAAKVPEPTQWLFEREALEQATAWAVAAERATRWPGTAHAPLVDVGSGAGVDALAVAVTGRPVVAYDRDPVCAALLRANAVALGVADLVEVRIEEAPRDLPADLVFVDPDRRSGGQRQTSAEDFSPPPAAWRTWSERARALVVKVAPATTWPDDGGDAPPFEVVSLAGRARERRLLLAGFADAAPRRALALPEGTSIEGAGDEELPEVGALEAGVWLLDPDTAVHHADLVPALALREGLTTPCAGRTDYLLGEAPTPTAPGTWLRIEAVLPPDAKRVNRWFAEAGVGRVEVRKRGVDDRAEAWRKKLRLGGPHAGHLVLLKGSTGRPLACVGRV
ncbi:MAG: hypothetical protein AB7T63_02740 [Planctomycetota bacterium]